MGNSSVVEELSRRERQIVLLVAKGWTNGQVAAYLNLSEQTVKNHLRNIYKKLRVRNRVQLVRLVLSAA
ncbi:MAG: LuxR C-terminal-related transcriptional regulator [Acidobacteriia bacterium]|nr:LuxR C-terminal-related transcriptional regulator [Terriglobia bacterium]